MHRGQIGEVRVGFFGSAPFVDEFQRLLFDFRKQHEMVNLVLQEMPTYQQVDAILDGRLDLGFVRPLQPNRRRSNRSNYAGTFDGCHAL